MSAPVLPGILPARSAEAGAFFGCITLAVAPASETATPMVFAITPEAAVALSRGLRRTLAEMGLPKRTPRTPKPPAAQPEPAPPGPLEDAITEAKAKARGKAA